MIADRQTFFLLMFLFELIRGTINCIDYLLSVVCYINIVSIVGEVFHFCYAIHC